MLKAGRAPTTLSSHASDQALTPDSCLLLPRYNSSVSPQTERRLVLIDGHSIIHRSFHAMKMVKEPLKLRSTGELIGAPFGFANTFLHMFGELKPTHVIVTLDMAGPTFRHEITDTYKATRVAMPDEERQEFSRQMKRSRQVIETFGIPIYELEGYEADDLMGALSVQAAKEGIDTFLVSMDSDIAQLVTPEVHLWMYRPYQRDSVIYTKPEDVLERYGVLPHQIADLKALKGDTSDNIPGIVGVGEKTAVKLVQQFGSVEAMLDNIDAIEQPKLQAAVRDASDQIRQSKRLAIIDSNAPVTLDLRAADFYAHYDRSQVSKFFQEMEFRTLLSRLPEPTDKIAVAVDGDGAAPAETRVTLVDSEDALDKLVNRIARQKSFVLDTETTTREAMRADLVGLSVALADGEAFYIPTGHAPRLGENGQLPIDLVLAKLAPLIDDPKIGKTGHYLKYDEVVLARHGVRAQGIAFDTMIAAHLLGEGGGAGRPEEGSLALGWLGARRLGVELQDRNALLNPTNKRSATITWDQVDINAAGQCAGACADVIARLRAVLEPELDEKGMRRLFDEVEMPLVSVLARMELNGVAVDTGALREMSESLTMEVRRIEEDIYASVGHDFNIGSPIQLSQILFEELHLPKTRRLKTGAYSTDQQSLEGLRGLHEIIDHIYTYRELTKLKSTYLDTLPFLVHPQTRRIHTEFNQTGAATGRLASSNPNLMNIPVRTELGEQ
ncbi:MAG: DNA polymerase I, partial [Chloroflexi bacterium]